MKLVLSVLHFLTVTRCSIVFDVKNQASQINKYCNESQNCLAGEHVMCMYGDKVTTMGPRCGGGKMITMSDSEVQLILDIINGFRAQVANGEEYGKNHKPLPRGYTMLRLEWSTELATFAQVWANQCVVSKKDYCRSTENYPNVGQSVGTLRFQYPNWDLVQKTFNDKTPAFTSEKRRYVIEKNFEILYNQKKHVTESLIRNPENNSGNTYIMMVHGSTTHVGCGMSTFIDYYETSKETPVIYYTAQVVCNFSNMPQAGRKVYETSAAQGEGWTPCGCYLDFYEDDQCLCVRGNNTNTENNHSGEKGENPDKKGGKSKENGDNSDKKSKEEQEKGSNSKENDSGKKHKEAQEKGNKSKENDSDKKHKEAQEKGDKPKENDSDKKHKEAQEKGDKPKENDSDKKHKEAQEKGDKSKEKGDNSNEKTDNSQENIKKEEKGKNLTVPSCGKGNQSCKSPVVVMPIIKVEDANSETLQKVQGLETTSMTTLELRKDQIRQKIRDRVQNVRDRYFSKNVFIEPGTRFSNGGEVGESDFAMSKFETELFANPTTRYNFPPKSKPNVNIKPRKDFSNLEELVSEYLLYKHNEAAKSPPKAIYRRFNDIRHIGSKPYGTSGGNERSVNYKYANNINNRQSPSIRKLRYGVQGFNYNKSPYISNLNDEHDQLSTDLYNLEEKSEDFAFNDNFNENIRMHNWDIASKYDLRSTKQIRHENPMVYSKPIEYARNEDIPPNMAYYARKKVQRPFTRPVSRIQNPMYSHPHSTNHYDYSKDYTNTQQAKSQSMLMKLANDENEDSHTHVYGYNRRQNRPNDGKNDVRNYYLDRLKHIRPFKRPNGGYGDSSEFHPRRQRGSDELRADKHYYYIPNRANHGQGFYE